MIGLRHLSLRWRLMIAFLLVSAPPVLVASYVASHTITAAFQRNMELWLEQAVQFLAGEAADAEDEAEKSVTVISSALAAHNVTDWGSDQSIQPFVDLLTTAGYDLVKIYDETGDVKFSTTGVDLSDSPPKTATKSVFRVLVNGAPGLAIGAARPFEAGGQRFVLFIANLVDEKLLDVRKANQSLEVRVFRLDHSELSSVVAMAGSGPLEVPNSVLSSLLGGAQSAVTPTSPNDALATAFAGLRDDAGRLIAIIACRFSGPAATFEKLSEWRLFAALALISGLISLSVGLFISRRISSPVHTLTHGLKAVAAGDYRARVPEEGGRELEELAAGFNAMTEQLDRLRQMEADMRRRQQFASLGEAAAVIAHEIRNPLGIIKTSSEVVRSKSALKPPQDRLMGFVLEEVGRIDRLVKDILDYARPKDTDHKVIDLLGVINRVVEVTGPELQRHNVICTVVGRRETLPVSGDPDQLYQTFLNLILNAVDAMPGGGRLTIDIGRDADAATIRVQDSGGGMGRDVKERIFDPFFTTKAKGTGLGLAKTKAIIEEHDGAILCESDIGCGATFSIRLPLAKEEAHAAAHPDR